MKILVIPSWYSTEEKPTLGSFFREQSLALVEKNLDVRIAYTELRNPKFLIKDKKKNKLKKEKIKDHGVLTYRVFKYNYLLRNKNYIQEKFYQGIEEILLEFFKEGWIPDLIHIHSFYPAGLSAYRILKEKGIPYVITEHSTGFSMKNYNKNQLKNLKKILKYSSDIIVVGKGLKEELEKYTCMEIKVIPNMVNCEKFLSNKKYESKKFVFFSLGYLTYKKGFDILLNSFSEAFKGNNNFILKIGGDGKEKLNLVKQSKKLGIEDQVKFLGSLTRDEVVCEMNKCNVFVLASRFETFGVVFIEALACGKPIIAPDISGPKEIVNKDNGLIFKNQNTNDLKKKLLKIVNKYEKYNFDQISRECLKKYNSKAVSKKIIKVYKDVLLKK